MYKSLFLFIIALTFINCSDSRSALDKFTNQAIVKCEKQMKKKGLMLVGLGCGEKDGKINLFSLRFKYQYVMDIAIGRDLIVDIVATLRNIIDSDESGKDFLLNSSVDTSTFDIIIIGISESIENPSYINIASICNNKVRYKIMPEYIRGQIAPPFVLIHEETIQEAQRIVGSESIK